MRRLLLLAIVVLLGSGPLAARSVSAIPVTSTRSYSSTISATRIRAIIRRASRGIRIEESKRSRTCSRVPSTMATVSEIEAVLALATSSG